jgi:hypothetical protein
MHESFKRRLADLEEARRLRDAPPKLIRGRWSAGGRPSYPADEGQRHERFFGDQILP